MKTFGRCLRLVPAALLALGALTGCESTDGGGSTTSIHTYYGVGHYDPWYYGHYDEDVDIIVTPPPSSPPGQGLRPSHPIAQPPMAGPRPMPRPMPSIPSMPRAAPRGGGGRR